VLAFIDEASHWACGWGMMMRYVLAALSRRLRMLHLWTTGLIQPPRVSHVLDLNYGWEPRKGLMIKRGNRVKLTAHAEATLNSGRGVKSIWTDRRGVILRVTANKANAVVLWDGRKSTECVPIRALETEPAELG